MQFLWVDAFFPWNYTYYTVQNNTRIKLEELFTTQMVKNKALHEFLWDSYLKLSLIFNWNAPSDPRCEDFFAGIVLAAIERASLG